MPCHVDLRWSSELGSNLGNISVLANFCAPPSPMIGERVQRLEYPELLCDSLRGPTQHIQHGAVQTVIHPVQWQRGGPAARLADQLYDEVQHLVRVTLEDACGGEREGVE